MNKTIKIRVKIKKITREDGKPESTMTVNIPVDSVAQIPLGMVNLTIEEVQQTMFEPKNKPVRGDKG